MTLQNLEYKYNYIKRNTVIFTFKNGGNKAVT
jgi:hypothetical protein